MTVFFRHNAEVAARHAQREDLTVEEFVKFNIYNTASLKYCFRKWSPLTQEQKAVLFNYLKNFKNGDIEGYEKNLEKWVRNADYLQVNSVDEIKHIS